MIFDKIKNFSLYSKANPLFEKLDIWLKNVDFNNLEIGKRIEIDGENIHAKIHEYSTVNSFEQLFESHKKYIDVHIILSGAEFIETAFLNGTEELSVPYDEIKERFKVKTQENCKLLLKEGEIAIFFPTDLHKTNIMASYKPEQVKKLVIKVLA